MNVNEEKVIRLHPEDAYGPIDPEGFKEISKSDVPEEGQKVGAVLSTQGTKGEDVVLRVSEVKDNTVVLDFNHPLAGKTLDFEIKVLDIQPAADARRRNSQYNLAAISRKLAL